MAVKHLTSGSLGAYAEHYVHPLAGFLVRYSAGCASCSLWFPGIPPWVWVIGFSAILIGVNAMNVKSSGMLGYWLSSVKVFAIVAFVIVVGGWLVFGSGTSGYGVRN